MEEAWAHSGIRFLGLFSDLLVNREANEVVAEFVRRKIAEVVDDPDTAHRLTPRGYPIFARRPCLDTGYYEAFNRDNVTLVDCLEEPIVEITETGLRTGTQHIEVDVIIAAMGYDALTGALLSIDITGEGGRSLKEKWSDGGRSYLGLLIEGFPNLFVIAGPNGPSALANFILLNEQNVDWICDCIEHMRSNGFRAVNADIAAENRWMDKVVELGHRCALSDRQHMVHRREHTRKGADISGVYRWTRPLPRNLCRCRRGRISRYPFRINGGRSQDGRKAP